MSASFTSSIKDIVWVRRGETATGNNIPDTDPSFPSGALNRPLVSIFNNTLNLRDRIQVVEAGMYNAFSPFANFSDNDTGVVSTVKNHLVLGSSNSQVSLGTSSILSSTNCKTAVGESSVIASNNSKVISSASLSKDSAIIASDDCQILGTGANAYSNFIASSDACNIEGDNPLKDTILSSELSSVKGESKHSIILASSRVSLEGKDYCLGGGYSNLGSSSTSNITWLIESMSGNISSKGVLQSGVTFSDYAEMFESDDLSGIPSGYIVSLTDTGKIKISDGDDPLGVVSETAGVILGSYSNSWAGKYVLTEFGKPTLEVNPDYTETAYIPREERPEWNVVGLLGQIRVRCDKDLKAGDRIQAKKGIAVKSEQGWRVMRILTPYTDVKGYGIALVFVR